jgi:uncharacterized cupin superfamily protein
MTPTADELRAKLIRNFNDVTLEPFIRAPLYESMGANLAKSTAAKKLGCGVDTLAPGKMGCPYHLHHAQEEMFIVLEGEGTLRVAGERLAIRAGDVIFVPPGSEYPHHIINTSNAPLKYLSISTQEEPEICEYPDSKKISAYAPNVSIRGRKETSLEYWDGEP